MTASIRAFDCLNPRLLSAQPWELLRIPLVGPEARTSSVPIQISLPAWSAGPGLMMSKTLPRDAGVIGPAFVHGYGSTGKARLQELDGLRAIPTIVESLCGWQRRPPSWATDKHGLLGAPGFHVYAPRSFQGLGARPHPSVL